MKSDSIFIIQPDNQEQEDELKAFVKALKLKFEIQKENSYNPDFIKKLKSGEQDLKEGKGKKTGLKQLESLWK